MVEAAITTPVLAGELAQQTRMQVVRGSKDTHRLRQRQRRSHRKLHQHLAREHSRLQGLSTVVLQLEEMLQ